MKTALRTIAVAGLLALLVVVSFGQTPQMTAVTTIAGDAVTATMTRGAIAYLPGGVIWIAAGDNPHTGKNFVYLSTDNGGTWVKRTLFTNSALSSPAVDGIAAKDANTAFVCTTTGEILRTTNGGVKWDTVTSYSTPDVAFCDGIAYVGTDTLVAYGDADAQGVYVSRSVNGGATWTRYTNLPTDSLKADGIYAGYASYASGMASYGRTAWATLYNTSNDPPGILKTTDGGATWSWFRVTLPGGPALNYYIRSITFKDQNVGFAVCKRAYVNDAAHDAYLVKTTDGGRTWSDTISVEPGKAHVDAKPMTVKAIPGTNTVVAVGWGTVGAKSWISYDNGTTWAVITTPTSSTSADLRNIGFGSATQGMAVGYYNFTKFTMGGGSTDSVNVTFWANTSTVPDTIKSNSFVQIRGAANVFGPWSKDSKAILANVAGDYWKGTVKLKIGDTVQYKFFTNVNNPLVGDPGGWENNSTSDASGNRIMIVGKADTTLPIQFVNGTPTNQAQFYTPYVNQKDSIEIYFRINMQGNESFDKTKQYMGVRGAFAAPYDGWGKSIVLTKESQHGNGGSQLYDGTNFWSGYTRVPKSLLASAIEYKFVIMDAPTPTANVLTWEDGIRPATDVTTGGNRQIIASPGASDTTLYWKWWANAPYAGFKGADTVIVTFRANLATAIAQRGFSFGDTIQVRSGYGATAKEVRTKAMTRSGITGTLFTATDTVITAVGKQLNYQYYLVKSGNDVREVFYDYDFTGSDVSQAERRKMNVTGKSLTTNDTSSSATDMRRNPRFRNSTKLSKAITVTYTLNLRPAFYQTAKGDTLFDIQGTNNITKNSNIKTLGVGINGPAVGGWASWGPAMIAAPDTVHKMYDDGTHGDAVAGDTIYSVQYKYTTTDVLGQEFKFGIGGSDNEGGKGGFGNNHVENLDDSQTTFVVASDWGSINPKYYSMWDFTNHKRTTTAVQSDWAVPTAYDLSQNYPNPFNPSTEIRFSLPTQEIVTLKIFNVLGQEIMTLMHEKLGAGVHTVRFDASKLTSGVYLYQISAGKFTETKKMVLMK